MFSGILIEGLIYGIMVLGLFCSYRVLNFCDMSVDGTFPMGACVFAVCISHGLSTPTALCIAFSAGILAGLVTSAIYTKLHIPDLLAGILTMTMLYSVNLRIMGNRANLSLLKVETLFSRITELTTRLVPGIDPSWGIVVFLLIFILVLKLLLDLFFHTDMGLTMGALGANPQLVISQGVNPTILRTIGICFGNGLAAVAGSFAAMYNGFADVGMGTGIVVSGLASLMLGEFIFRSNKISMQTLRVLIGSIIYRALMILVRTYGRYIHITPNDLKLVTGILICICLIFTRLKIRDKYLAKKEMKAAAAKKEAEK